jgi:hypothetical protein
MAAHSAISWAGIAAGPCAWGVNTVLNYALLPWTCTHGTTVAMPVSVILALIALAGTAGSWIRWRRLPMSDINAPESRMPDRFLAGLGVLLGILFATVILTQGSATFVLGSCAR